VLELNKKMKKNILLICALIPLICYGQSNKHIFFGIDLDSGWKSLTNQQALAYFIQDQDKNSNFIITDCDHISDKIDTKFLNIGFKELLLIFPKGNKGKLANLNPDMFLARISYTDSKEYEGKSNKDIRKILSVLKDEYGEPELNIIKDKYSDYQFNGIYYQIIVTCREDELSTTLIYTKK
jgi:hypothetical protein